MNTKRKVAKKISISLGVTLAITSPLIASAALIRNTNEVELNNYKNAQYSTISVDSRFEHKELIYYLQHRDELWNLISTDYDDLSTEFSNSQVANEWVESIANKDITDLDAIISSLESLKIDEGLRLFILQNLFEKVDIYKFGNLNKRSNTPEYRYRYPDSYLQNPEIYTAENPGPNGEITPIPQPGDYETEQAQHQNVLGDASDEFEFYRVSVADAQPWDIGEAKGDFDHISGMFYSQKLMELHQTTGSGWNNDDADSGWTAKRVTFEFRELDSQRIDSFNLMYNTARDTNNNNEDYTFVAIEPKDAQHITTDFKGNRVPSLFGMPVSFNETLLHNSYAHQDNAYIISGHEVDKGDDNEAGNVLEGVPNAPVVNMLNARRSFNHIAADLVNGMLLKLNYNPERGNNPLDRNFLYLSNDTEEYAVAHSEYYRDEITRERINRNGFDRTDTDYGTFTNDDTWIHWSNQTVLNYSLAYFVEQMQSFYREVQSEYGDDITSDVATIYSNTISIALSRVKDLTGPLAFTTNAIAGTWLSSAVSLLQIDWSSWQSITSGIASVGVSVASPFLIDFLVTRGIISGTVGSAIGTAIPVVGIIAAASQLLFSFIPSGNGHSLMSNVNDHGLNDFDSQLSTNKDTMAKIAVSFSEKYHEGIIWYVVDSWGGLPELRIKTEGEPDSNYVYLSGGDSFNYGHNIDLRLKDEA